MRAAKFLSTPIQAGPGMPVPYSQLCVLERRLILLWDDAVYYGQHWARHPVERARGTQATWRMMRADLLKLVGPGRPDGDDILSSLPAYDCAARALRAAMGMDF